MAEIKCLNCGKDVSFNYGLTSIFNLLAHICKDCKSNIESVKKCIDIFLDIQNKESKEKINKLKVNDDIFIFNDYQIYKFNRNSQPSITIENSSPPVEYRGGCTSRRCYSDVGFDLMINNELNVDHFFFIKVKVYSFETKEGNYVTMHSDYELIENPTTDILLKLQGQSFSGAKENRRRRMFKKREKYVSDKVNELIPEDIQVELWDMIDKASNLSDVQFFKIYVNDEKLYVRRSQRNPEFIEEKEIKSSVKFCPQSAIEIVCIHDYDLNKMLLSKEFNWSEFY